MRLACVVAAGCLMIPCGLAQAPGKKMIQVDDTFNSREVTIQVGDTLEVSLSENASTGYQWSIPPAVKNKLTPALREREESVDAPDGPPGRPAIRHLYFEALAPGTVDLEIHYRRSWESDKPPARKFTLRVLVTKGS